MKNTISKINTQDTKQSVGTSPTRISVKSLFNDLCAIINWPNFTSIQKHLHPPPPTTHHESKPPPQESRSSYPNIRGQRDIAPWDPWHDSYGSDNTINQPQHTFIRHHHPQTMTPRNHHKKPRSGYPNWRSQRDIVSQDPRLDSSISDSKIKDRHDSSGSNDTRHYRKGGFLRSHSSCTRRHRQSPNNFPPEDMNDKDMVDAGWIFNNRRTPPCTPCAW